MPEDEKKKDNSTGAIGVILVIAAIWAINRFLKRHPKLLRVVTAVFVIVFGVSIIQSIISGGFYGYKEKFDSFAGHSQGAYLVFLSLAFLIFLLVSIGIFTPCKNCLEWNILLKKEKYMCKKCGQRLEPPAFVRKNGAEI